MEVIKHFLCLAAGVPLLFGVLLAMPHAAGPSRWKQIDPARMLENIKVLSSDEYEGRAPASKGETLAKAYIEERFNWRKTCLLIHNDSLGNRLLI